MKVQNIIPNYNISPYIDRILVIENEVPQKPFTLHLYANGIPSLLFTSIKGKFGKGNHNYLTLFGQTIVPEHLTLDEDFTIIAYFLKPHTLISLFGIAGYELTDNPIDLNLILSPKNNHLQDKLLNSENVEIKIQTLDNYILNLIKSSKEISPTLKYAYEKLTDNYSKESLLSVQKELNITERTFQRLFERNLGISPNTYRRICQFNSAFNDLNLGKYSNLSDIAYNHGYADQSHYIRSFKEFTKITPKEYLNYGVD